MTCAPTLEISAVWNRPGTSKSIFLANVTSLNCMGASSSKFLAKYVTYSYGCIFSNCRELQRVFHTIDMAQKIYLL